MVEKRRTRLGHIRIYYETAGEGPALLLVHGLSGSTRWWAKNIPAFARHFRVYALDLAGFGGSRGSRFNLADTPGLLLQWMDALREAQMHLVGHSMGGLVATEVAVLDPARVGGLVLVDAVGAPMHRSLLGSALRLPLALRYSAPDFLPVLALDALRAGPANLLRASLAIHRADTLARLGSLAARALVVWGEQDKLLPLPLGQQLHHALPGSDFVVVPGAGHNPMWDRPEAFNRAVIDFLSADEQRLPRREP